MASVVDDETVALWQAHLGSHLCCDESIKGVRRRVEGVRWAGSGGEWRGDGRGVAARSAHLRGDEHQVAEQRLVVLGRLLDHGDAALRDDERVLGRLRVDGR